MFIFVLVVVGGGIVEVKVLDIGDYIDVLVIEISVKVGDKVEVE